MPAPIAIPRPSSREHSEAVGRYLAGVPGEDAWPVLVAQAGEVDRRLGALPEDRALHRYAPGKWSVKEVLGHLSDCERVFAYRALRYARGDETPLPGFDENAWMPTARFDVRPIGDLLGWSGGGVCRAGRWGAVVLGGGGGPPATLSLFRGLDPEALLRRGVADAKPVSVRALAWLTAGHTLHHLGVLRERYGIR